MQDTTPALETPPARPASVVLGPRPGRPLPPRPIGRTRLEAVWARHEDEVRAAQRLRHRVFGEEMGACLRPLHGTPPGHDCDVYDRHCEHLLVRTVASSDRPSEVVGTYRLLTPTAARMVGGLYTETEFDLVRLARLRPRLAELGRSCVDPAWRSGGVILMLWSSLTDFMLRNRLDLMIGCASVPMRDGGFAAASLWHQLRQTHLAPIERHVLPRLPLPVDELRCDLPVEPPPLVKGYLRCGAKLLGPPAWDPDFGTADLPLMLDLNDATDAFRRHFLAR